MSRHLFLFLSVLMLLVVSCSRAPETPEEYTTWFSNPSNGYVKTRQINGMEFSLLFRPAELLLMQELDPAGTYSPAELDSLLALYNNGYHFIFSVRLPKEFFTQKVGNTRDYLDFFETMSFRLPENIRLKTSTEELPVSLFHHERGYELQQQNIFLVSFPRSPDDGDTLTFQYKDDFFGVSTLNFTYVLSHLESPSLPIKIQ